MHSFLDVVLAGHLLALTPQVLARVLLLQRVGVLGGLRLGTALGGARHSGADLLRLFG